MKLRLVVAGVGLLCLCAPALGSDDPTPSTCKVGHIAICPAGDMRVGVLVRKGGQAMGGALVTMDLSGCSALKLGVPLPGEEQTLMEGVRVMKRTADNGRALFSIRGGGAGVCSRVTVLAEGVLIAERTAVASPDQNGDLVVDQSDLDALKVKVGTKDETGDMDGDGRVTPADLLLARLHLGHHADLVTETKTRTWGEIKGGYR
jgi:hypothetical protein